MVFQCSQCGSCCMYLGDYITIEQQVGPFEFECLSVSTGTPFVARVDDDKRELFLETTWIEQHPRACRFLRPSGDRIVCTVHETSAPQCKFYRCVVFHVSLPDGSRIGTVTGTLNLHTDDQSLRGVWEKGNRVIRWDSPDTEDQVAAYLRDQGYVVD